MLQLPWLYVCKRRAFAPSITLLDSCIDCLRTQAAAHFPMMTQPKPQGDLGRGSVSAVRCPVHLVVLMLHAPKIILFYATHRQEASSQQSGSVLSHLRFCWTSRYLLTSSTAGCSPSDALKLSLHGFQTLHDPGAGARDIDGGRPGIRPHGTPPPRAPVSRMGAAVAPDCQ